MARTVLRAERESGRSRSGRPPVLLIGVSACVVLVLVVVVARAWLSDRSARETQLVDAVARFEALGLPKGYGALIEHHRSVCGCGGDRERAVAVEGVAAELCRAAASSGVADHELAIDDEVELARRAAPLIESTRRIVAELARALDAGPSCAFGSFADEADFRARAEAVRADFARTAWVLSWHARQLAADCESDPELVPRAVEAHLLLRRWVARADGVPDGSLQHTRITNHTWLARSIRGIARVAPELAAQAWTQLELVPEAMPLEPLLHGLAARVYQGVVVEPVQPDLSPGGAEAVVEDAYWQREWALLRIRALELVCEVGSGLRASIDRSRLEQMESEGGAFDYVVEVIYWPSFSTMLPMLDEMERAVRVTAVGVWGLDQAHRSGGWVDEIWPDSDHVTVLGDQETVLLRCADEEWDLGTW